MEAPKEKSEPRFHKWKTEGRNFSLLGKNFAKQFPLTGNAGAYV